jgi:hypothetical protein
MHNIMMELCAMLIYIYIYIYILVFKILCIFFLIIQLIKYNTYKKNKYNCLCVQYFVISKHR